jgi:hypothetical protein
MQKDALLSIKNEYQKYKEALDVAMDNVEVTQDAYEEL